MGRLFQSVFSTIFLCVLDFRAIGYLRIIFVIIMSIIFLLPSLSLSLASYFLSSSYLLHKESVFT